MRSCFYNDKMSTQIKLNNPQSRFFSSAHFATAFVGGFGSGKSEGLFTRMLSTKLQFPQNDLAYFAPTYSLIKDIAYVRLDAMLSSFGVQFNLNKTDHYLKIKNCGKILFRTLDNPDKIVGFEVMDGFIDELDTLPFDVAENCWNKVIARCRQKPKHKAKHKRPENQIFVGTTPEGFNFTWKMWESEPREGYYQIKARTDSNPHLPKNYIENLKNSYSKELIEAYLNGEYVNLIGKTVYHCYDSDKNNTDRQIRKGDKLYVGCDFNVNNMSAVIHVIEDGHPLAVGEITGLTDTPDLIRELNRYRDEGHQVIVYPDSTGKSNKTIDASKSDIQLFRNEYFEIRAPYSNPPIKDRISSMNGMFCNSRGERRYLVNRLKCPEYSNALLKQTWESNGKPKKTYSNNIDDLNDAAGYFMHYEFSIDKIQFSSRSVAVG